MRSQPRYKKGDRIGGRFLVHQALMGGMGEVYLCLDEQERYPYALKTFQRRYLEQSQALLKAFEREVLAWVALEKHPNLVRCFYMDTFDNQPFMVLEWVAGEEGRGADLRGWLRRGPLELPLALQITIDICRGLSHAQAKQPGLVHRDLKPENVLIAQGGTAKVTDFGLAEIVQAAELETAMAPTSDGRQTMATGRGIAGTPAYMSPEQWQGNALDERADIYAVGCILYEMLTGSWPFHAGFMPTSEEEWAAWLRAMQGKHEQERVPSLPAAFSADLNDLLQSCLAKTAAGRPQSLAALLDRLTRLYRQQVGREPPARPEAGLFTAVDYNNRGSTYAALQQHQAALADFSRAIDLDPNFAGAYLNLGALLANQGQLREALAYFEKAAQLGHTQGAQYAAQVRQRLGIESVPRALDPAQQAFEDFQQAGSLAAMRQVVASHPILINANFITAIEQAINQQVPPEQWPAFEQRLIWLRQIASQSSH
jgi:serine/threonine protein kinase